jgi:hypothetical protein
MYILLVSMMAVLPYMAQACGIFARACGAKPSLACCPLLPTNFLYLEAGCVPVAAVPDLICRRQVQHCCLRQAQGSCPPNVSIHHLTLQLLLLQGSHDLAVAVASGLQRRTEFQGIRCQTDNIQDSSASQILRMICGGRVIVCRPPQSSFFSWNALTPSIQIGSKAR